MKRLILNCATFLATLTLTSNLFANAELPRPIGTESISEEERLLAAAVRAIEEEELEAPDQNEHYLSLERRVVDPFYPIDYSLHTVRTIGYKQRTVSLNNGSLWVVRPADAKILEKWIDEQKSALYPDHSPSGVYITPNSNWFFSRDYEFRMVNYLSGASIYCDIAEPGPSYLANEILQVDRQNGEVVVVNNVGNTVRFSLSRFDASIHLDWLSGHRIIFGRNSRWGSSANPYVLYNLDKDSIARGCNL